MCFIPYFRKHTWYGCNFWYSCVKWWHLQMLFSFFKKFYFSRVLGGNMAKNGQRWQKILSHSHSVYLELYLIWLWFLVHLCKMMISSAILVIQWNLYKADTIVAWKTCPLYEHVQFVEIPYKNKYLAKINQEWVLMRKLMRKST